MDRLVSFACADSANRSKVPSTEDRARRGWRASSPLLLADEQSGGFSTKAQPGSSDFFRVGIESAERGQAMVARAMKEQRLPRMR